MINPEDKDPESVFLSILENLEISAACAACGRLSLQTFFSETCAYCGGLG